MKKDRPKSRLITPEAIDSARRNVGRYPWAAAERDSAVERAQRWMALNDEFLWGLVAEQTIGRSTNASVE